MKKLMTFVAVLVAALAQQGRADDCPIRASADSTAVKVWNKTRFAADVQVSGNSGQFRLNTGSSTCLILPDGVYTFSAMVYSSSGMLTQDVWKSLSGRNETVSIMDEEDIIGVKFVLIDVHNNSPSRMNIFYGTDDLSFACTLESGSSCTLKLDPKKNRGKYFIQSRVPGKRSRVEQRQVREGKPAKPVTFSN